jgi:hypothetical protein
MARQLRIEYDGALYHVMSRGNEQRDIILGHEWGHTLISEYNA